MRTVLDRLFDCLSAWLAPFVCFTAEEAWRARHPDGESVHLRLFPALPQAWQDDALAERIERMRSVRRVVTKALEQARAAKKHRLLAGGGADRVCASALPRRAGP